MTVGLVGNSAVFWNGVGVEGEGKEAVVPGLGQLTRHQFHEKWQVTVSECPLFGLSLGELLVSSF